jgi:hypothetical protein
MSRTHKDRKLEWPTSGWGYTRDPVKDSEWDKFQWWKVRSRRNSRLRTHCEDWWGAERRKVKQALARGEEPEPTRTRHSVGWAMS